MAAALNVERIGKYWVLLLVVCAAITGVVIAFNIHPESERAMQAKKVRIPFFQSYDVTRLDPAKITDSVQSNLLRSIFSTLMYFDVDGQIRPGAAQSFEVLDRTIRFKMRDDVRTLDGHTISAEDVYMSFKRQLVLNKNTHGKLVDFLDCMPLPQKMSDSCSGIFFKDNFFEITLKNSKYVPFFLPMLASPDFSIIPKNSLDLSSDSLKILDFKNTSGSYYIEKTSEDGVLFKVNKSHYLTDHRNPDEIEIVFNVGNDRNQKFAGGQFDVIPTFAVFTNKDIKSLGDLSSYNIHQTMPIQLTLVDFSSLGRKKLNKEQRFAVGAALKKAYLDTYQKVYDLEEAVQYFVVVGEGELDAVEVAQIRSALTNSSMLAKFDSPVTADIAVTWPEKAKVIIEGIPNFQYKELPLGEGVSSASAPDAFVITTDAGGFDNITLLSYIQSVNSFGLSDIQFSEWLDDYIGTVDIKERLSKFRRLHLKMLSEAHVIPIASESYFAIARKPWRVEGYQMFAGTPFWMIKHE